MSNKITIGTIAVFVLFIGGFWALNYFLFGVPGVVISCENNSFVGFSSTSMPPAQMACFLECNAEITITDNQENIICSNKAKGCETNRVLIPCKELEDYIGQELNLKYSIENGENKTEKIQYNPRRN
jgi:hypothetical protein